MTISLQIERRRSAASGDETTDFWKTAFEELVSQFPEPVFVIDDEGRISGWNDEMVNLLGYTADDVMGQNAYDVFGTEGEDETLAETVLKGGQPIRETDIRTASDAEGNPFHSRALAVPIRDSGGEIVSVFEVISSVTDLIETQRTMEQIQTEVSENVETKVGDLRNYAEETDKCVKKATSLSNEQVTRLETLRDEVF